MKHLNRCLSFLLAFFIVFGLLPPGLDLSIEAKAAMAGDGTAANPYIIMNQEDWKAASWSSSNIYYKLGADISITSSSATNMPYLRANFDGAGKTINLSVSTCGTQYYDNGFLFSEIEPSGVFKNCNILTGGLTFENNSTSDKNFGVIAGENKGLIKNCRVAPASGRVYINCYNRETNTDSKQYNYGVIAGHNTGDGEIIGCIVENYGLYMINYSDSRMLVGGIAGRNGPNDPDYNYSRYPLMLNCIAKDIGLHVENYTSQSSNHYMSEEFGTVVGRGMGGTIEGCFGSLNMMKGTKTEQGSTCTLQPNIFGGGIVERFAHNYYTLDGVGEVNLNSVNIHNGYTNRSWTSSSSIPVVGSIPQGSNQLYDRVYPQYNQYSAYDRLNSLYPGVFKKNTESVPGYCSEGIGLSWQRQPIKAPEATVEKTPEGDFKVTAKRNDTTSNDMDVTVDYVEKGITAIPKEPTLTGSAPVVTSIDGIYGKKQDGNWIKFEHKTALTKGDVIQLYARVSGQNINEINPPKIKWTITGASGTNVQLNSDTGILTINESQITAITLQAECAENKVFSTEFTVSDVALDRTITEVDGASTDGQVDMSKYTAETEIPIEFKVTGVGKGQGKIFNASLTGKNAPGTAFEKALVPGTNNQHWVLKIGKDQKTGPISADVLIQDGSLSAQPKTITLVDVVRPEISAEFGTTIGTEPEISGKGTVILVPNDTVDTVKVKLSANKVTVGGVGGTPAYKWSLVETPSGVVPGADTNKDFTFTVDNTCAADAVKAKVIISSGSVSKEYTVDIDIRKVTDLKINKEASFTVDATKKAQSIDLAATAMLKPIGTGSSDEIAAKNVKWTIDPAGSASVVPSPQDNSATWGKATLKVTPVLGKADETVTLTAKLGNKTASSEVTIKHPQGTIKEIGGNKRYMFSLDNTSENGELVLTSSIDTKFSGVKNLKWTVEKLGSHGGPNCTISDGIVTIPFTDKVVSATEYNYTVTASCDELEPKTATITVVPALKPAVSLGKTEVTVPVDDTSVTITANAANLSAADMSKTWTWSLDPADDPAVTIFPESTTGKDTTTISITKAVDFGAEESKTFTVKAGDAVAKTFTVKKAVPKVDSFTLTEGEQKINVSLGSATGVKWTVSPESAGLSFADTNVGELTVSAKSGFDFASAENKTFTITATYDGGKTAKATVVVKNPDYASGGSKLMSKPALQAAPKPESTTPAPAAPKAEAQSESVNTANANKKAEPEVKPEEKLQKAEPEVKPDGKLPKAEPEVKPEEKLPKAEPEVKPEEKLPKAEPEVKPEKSSVLSATTVDTAVAESMTATTPALSAGKTTKVPAGFIEGEDIILDDAKIITKIDSTKTKVFVTLNAQDTSDQVFYHIFTTPSDAVGPEEYKVLEADAKGKYQFKFDTDKMVPRGTLYTDKIEVIGDCYIAVCAKKQDAINIERSNTRVYKITGNTIASAPESQDTNSLVQPTRREYKVTIPGSASDVGPFKRTSESPRIYEASINAIRKLVTEDSWNDDNARDRALAEGEAVNVKITIKEYENFGGNAGGYESVGSVIAPVIISPLSTDEAGNPIILGGEGISLTCASKNADIYYTISEGSKFVNPDLLHFVDRKPYEASGKGKNVDKGDLSNTFKYQGTKIPFYDNLNGMTIVAIAAKKNDTNTTSTRTTKETFTNENRTNLNDAYVYVSNDPAVKDVAFDEHAYYKKQNLTIAISHPDLKDGVNVAYTITAGAESLTGDIISDKQVIDLPANYKDVGSLTLTVDVTKDNYKPINSQYTITFTGAYSAPQVYAVNQVRRGQNVEQEISRLLTSGSSVKNGQEIMIVLNPKDMPAGMAPSAKPVATVNKNGQPVANGEIGNSVTFDESKTEVRLDLATGQQYLVPTVKYSFTGTPDKNYELGKPIILKGQSSEVTTGVPVKFSKSPVTVSASETTSVTFSSDASVTKWEMTPAKVKGIVFDGSNKTITIGTASDVFPGSETSKQITITGYENEGDGKPVTSGVLTILNTGVDLPEKTYVKESAVPYGIIALPQGKAGDTVEINLLVTGSATDKSMEVPVKFTYTIQANLDPPKIEATPVEGTTDMLEVNTDISVITEDLSAEIYYTTENMEITEADLNAGIAWEEEYVHWLIMDQKIKNPDINQKIENREKYINKVKETNPDFSEPKVLKYYRPFKAEMNEQKLLYVRAVAVSSDGSKGTSIQAMQKYKLKDLEKSKSPTANPATTDSNPTALQRGAMITLSADVNEINPVIYYTIDGTEPKPFMTDIGEVPADGAKKDSTFKISSGGQVKMEPADGSSTFVIRAKVSQGSKLKTLADSIESRFTYRLAKAGAPSIVPETNSSINTEAEVAKLPEGSVIRLIAKEQNAKIYYTTDGTIPTTSSKLYDPEAGIKMGHTDTFFIVSAIVNDPNGNYADSDVLTYYYQSPAPVQAVYAVPAATAPVVKGTKVELKCSTEGAKIFYEIARGSATPGEPVPYTSQSYDPANPIVIDEKTTINVIAEREGVKSKISTWTYDVAAQISAPTPSIATGSIVYPSAKLHLMAPAGSEVVYTKDGSDPADPENKNALFGQDIVLDGKEGESMSIRALARAPQKTPSDVVTFTYSISPAAEILQVSPPNGAVVSQGTSVSLSTPITNGKIYSATGGKNPFDYSGGRNSIILHGMPGETITVKAAVKIRYTDEYIDQLDPDEPNYKYDEGSAPLVLTYTMMEKTQGPTSSIPTGAITLDGAEAALTCKEGTIYYTLDGTDPTTSSQIYTGPIKVTGSMVLKAMALAENKEPSDIVTYIYTRAGDAAAATTQLPGGEIVSGTKVELTSPTEGATIYYSTNGMTPSLDVLDDLFVYTDPITVTRPVTLKFFAYKDGMHPSPVNTVTYTVYDPPEPEPEKVPETGLRPTSTDRLTSRRTFDSDEIGPSFTDVVLYDRQYSTVVSAKKQAVPEEVVLVTKQIPHTKDEEKSVKKEQADFGILSLYDITLTRDGLPIQPESEIEIGLPIPSEYQNGIVLICRINDDSSAEFIPTRRAGGMAYAKVEHLSKYALVSPMKDSDAESARWLLIGGITVGALALGGLIAFLLWKKKKQDDEDREETEV